MTTHFDAEIDKQHAAAQAAEDRAVAVIERMRRIPGLTSLVDKLPRKFGEAPNPYKSGSRNLTVAGVLEKADPALAHYLAGLVGASLNAPDYTEIAALQQQAASADRLRQQTEHLAFQNQMRNHVHERASIAGINIHTGRRVGQ